MTRAFPIRSVKCERETKESHRKLFMYAGISPGLLFDWALPLLNQLEDAGSGGTGSSAKHVGSLFWVLTALQEGLLHCDDRIVARYGNTLFNACQGLLESDDLSIYLLPPILAVLTQVRVQSSHSSAHAVQAPSIYLIIAYRILKGNM